MGGHQMKHIEAHELMSADRGVHIVASTLALTYVGWFQSAKQGPDGFIDVHLEDFHGLRVSLVLPPRSHLHIEPFPPLAAGDMVVRYGYADPDHANYRRQEVGRVERCSRDTRKNRVYEVRWDGELQTRWHTRRRLEPAPPEVVAEIRAQS